MVTDTFFDLQRFDEGDNAVTTTALLGDSGTEGDGSGAEGGESEGSESGTTGTSSGVTNVIAAEDTLVSSTVNGGTFTLQNGNEFLGADGTTVEAGTANNPAHIVAAGEGTAALNTGSGQIVLNGTKEGYAFAFNQDKTNWEVGIKGSANTVATDLNGNYVLGGEATVNIYAGKSFDETVNGTGNAVYVKAPADSNLPFVMSADTTDPTAINYTFADAEAMAVVLDGNDTAVFRDSNDTNGFAATNISIGAATKANPEAASIGSVYFLGDASVTSDTTEVNISVKDSVTVGVSDDVWTFTNKSTRDDAELVIGASGEVVSVSATKSATVYAADDGIETPVNVNGTKWDAIIADTLAGNLLEVDFDDLGNATINNIDPATGGTRDKGGVTVKGAAGATAEFATITGTGVIANTASIQSNAAVDDVKVTLEESGERSGIAGMEMDLADGVVTVSGDEAFDVKVANDTFNVTTSADSIAVDVINVNNITDIIPYNKSVNADRDGHIGQIKNLYINGNVLNVTKAEHEKAYTVTGGEAIYNTETVVGGGQYNVTINGAAVNIKNGDPNTADAYKLTSDDKKAGVDEAIVLKPNDAIKVSGDSDGFTAIYKPATAFADGDIVTFKVNDAQVSVQARFVDEDYVTVVAGADNQVTVQGIEGSATVSVAGGGTVYHFKNELGRNKVVSTDSDEYTKVTLTSGGDVMTVPSAGVVKDVIDDNDIPRVQADQEKWNELATVGGSTVNSAVDDTVESHHANVYENFYDLVNSAVSGNTVAGFENPDDENPTESTSNINIVGETPLGTPTVLGEAIHVTLNGGPAVGSVPINIQSDENTTVNDVTVALGSATVPSTVAVGTHGIVTASHNVQLSNAGTPTAPSYGYIGVGATGQNVLSVETGSAMLRHDGENRASLFGGTNIDTIRGDVNDVVSGGAEADYFYDLSGYALDYNVAEGDVIIASRLANIGEVTQANIRGNGNQIGFGNGEYLLTLGNIDPNAAVHVKVATMDNDGNLMKGVKDVVLANGNGTVDATAAGENGALIITDSTRDNVPNSNGVVVPQVHEILGSAGADTIQAGAYDIVNGALGNDDIYIENGAGAPGVVVALTGGDDSVTGWTFGFDRAKGATQLVAGSQVVGRVFEDRMYVSLVGGEASISFNDTKALGNSDSATMHGQYDVLVDNMKFTMIRNGDARTGYAIVDSNDDVADYYMAEREGIVHFTGNVTDLIGDETRVYGMGVVDLTTENFHAIRNLDLQNNSKTVVYGSGGRETVTTGGQAVLGANKFVSLGADNDVIISGGDGNPSLASNAFFFGAGDGRDTIHNFNHYQGINEDPDKQSADLIVLQSLAGVKAEVDEQGYTRVEFALNADTSANEYALIYEAPGTYDYNKNMYRVQITNPGAEGIAKIGYSTAPNVFTYDKEVSYYVGSSGEARDTLVINTINENVEVRMDGQKQDGKFYRGIGAINASAATYTNTTLAGNASNNLIVAGGEGTNNFLWGGAGDNTLIGGAGKDFFLYTKNANAYVAGADHSDTSGTNDIVTGYDCNNDVIILSDVTLADINYAAMLQAGGTNNSNCGITENAVTVSFNNGGSVTVDPTDQSKVTFYINDGTGQLTAFSADRESGTWKRG